MREVICLRLCGRTKLFMEVDLCLRLCVFMCGCVFSVDCCQSLVLTISCSSVPENSVVPVNNSTAKQAKDKIFQGPRMISGHLRIRRKPKPVLLRKELLHTFC